VTEYWLGVLVQFPDQDRVISNTIKMVLVVPLFST